MICAVVLAAGQSRRMGATKQLLPFGAGTVIGHVVDQLVAGGLDGIFVVVGHEAEQVAAALAGRPVHVVTNPDYAAGMLSSVRCGLRALPPQCDAVMIALGDQPAISPPLVRALCDSFSSFSAAGKGILVPVCDGRRGHPLLFAARYCAEI
jgi:molybdenum cofactor cytidylyltransferase